MNINHPLLKGTLKKIMPNIYGVIIKDQYDRAMLFACYQEYYESPFPEIRGQNFTLETLMRVYTKKNKKDCFTYPKDWGGYNIPSNILLERFHKLEEKNLVTYELLMRNIIFECVKLSKTKPFYLIGVDNIKSVTMNHEMAHGLYYTNEKYKEITDKLISEMNKKDYQNIKKKLVKMGYVNEKKIIDDEIQAYMSTGLYGYMNVEDLIKYKRKFVQNFNKFKK